MPVRQVIEGAQTHVKVYAGEVEESARRQLENLASIPFIHHHIAAMPDVHAGMGATIGSVIPTLGAIIPAAVGVDIGCFHGDTKIPLLDGSQATLRELEQRQEPFWVYSINSDLRIAPGRAVCRKTREYAELLRLVISGGEEILCTPDHEFMLSDGSYRRAQDLAFNDSLMPLYRKWQTRDGYESASNGQGTSKMTHILVWEALNGTVPKGHVVHHGNHIHFDNQPGNLQLMRAGAHSSYHRKVGHSFDNTDPAFQRLRKAGIARRLLDPEKRAKMVEIGSENIQRYMRERPEHFAEAVASNGERGKPFLVRFNTSPLDCPDCGEQQKNPAALRWHREKQHAYNHKVLLIELSTERADVYCLQVEEHHNFALAAGVFVHNCGMTACRLDLTASQLPDNLKQLRLGIEAAVPHGRSDNGGKSDAGGWGFTPFDQLNWWREYGVEVALPDVLERHPRLMRGHVNTHNHLGTLGTGNHFIEVCLDETDQVWIMLHSGSRGIGNRIGSYFIELAKQDMRRWFINLPDKDLAYLVEGTEHFDDYVRAVGWAQDYARMNRNFMMAATLKALDLELDRETLIVEMTVECHHNYIAKENHFGANVWITRKGAVRAREGDMGIIPGSMGKQSYIVRGKGNRDALHSCSHGAGRNMSRTAARRRFTEADLIAQTAGVECRKDDGVLDEIPEAYKDLDVVMANQSDLVEIVHTLRQIVNVKG